MPNVAQNERGLYRLRKSSIQGLVLKGHHFSRANKANEIGWALAPDGMVSQDSHGSAARFAAYTQSSAKRMLLNAM